MPKGHYPRKSEVEREVKGEHIGRKPNYQDRLKRVILAIAENKDTKDADRLKAADLWLRHFASEERPARSLADLERVAKAAAMKVRRAALELEKTEKTMTDLDSDSDAASDEGGEEP